MSLVIAQQISVAYGRKSLFDGASFSIGESDRLGLVGPNGTGKSTLLKVLAGRLTPDAGKLVFRRQARAGYLPQDIAALPEGSLIGSVLASVPGREELSGRLVEVQAALESESSPEAQLELAGVLGELHEQLEHFEERFGRHRAARILCGLGFKEADFERATATFSGGWRMRAALAGLLLLDPELLLLDEPTNHLDLPTLEWFDDFLRRSPRALVLICHDRDFLNRQINRVLSLEVEGLRSYTGDYESYRRQRAEERSQLLARAERQAARRAELESFIERFGAKASKAKQAQSRAKQLEKEEIIEVHQERAKVDFAFPAVERSGREVLTLTGVRKAYGENLVYEGLSATLLRGQRVAVVGLNGAGKSTLLKLVASELSADAGEVTLGHNVRLGYYAQHHGEGLDANSTVLEEVWRLVPDRPQSHLRSVLGSFLFSGDDVDKKVGVLSGGERARVALAKLLLRPANFLLLDEPTNHLDLDSAEVLIEALRSYEGSLLFVTHNKSFLNQLATTVWDVRDRQVVPYPGNLDEYLEHLRISTLEQTEAAAPSRRESGEKDRKRQEAEARQRRNSTLGPLKKEIAALETRIAALEGSLREEEAALADPSLYEAFEKARPLMELHRAHKVELEALYGRWEKAQAELAHAEGQLA